MRDRSVSGVETKPSIDRSAFQNCVLFRGIIYLTNTGVFRYGSVWLAKRRRAGRCAFCGYRQDDGRLAVLLGPHDPGLSEADAAILCLTDFRPKRCWLAMLRTYIDDSGRGQKPNFVFAGFVARAEHWLDFDKAWQAALAGLPVLAYLKTKDGMAQRPGGPFKGWHRKDIDQRMGDLMTVIESNYAARVGFSVPHDLFAKYFGGRIAKRMDTPYVFTAYLLILNTLRALYDEGCREIVDFVFDTTDKTEQDLIRNGWWIARRTALPRLKPLMSNPPDFRDDKIVLPLQAADLYAWHLRKARQTLGWDHPIWQRLEASRRVVEHDCEEAEIAKVSKRIRELHDQFGLRFFYDPKPGGKRL